jgi:hypothetical protein
MTSDATDEAFLEWLRKSCEASGVPLKVTDPATIRKVATLLSVGRPAK